MWPAGSRGRALTPPWGEERGGARFVWDCAGEPGNWGNRPARALRRPGSHAPISEEPLGDVGGRSVKDVEPVPAETGTGAGREERGGGFVGAAEPISSPGGCVGFCPVMAMTHHHN